MTQQLSAPTTLPELVATRCWSRPDALAVRYDGSELTARQLEHAVRQLAGQLRDAGVERGDRVVLMLPRSLTWVVGTLAVLEAGGTFVPIDPKAPIERIRAILDDAEPRLVLAAQADRDELSGCLVLVPAVAEPNAEFLNDAPAVEPKNRCTGDDIAYVIYTSGSTGTPKGVVVSHRSVLSFVAAVGELFELRPTDRLVGYASCAFDVSIFDLFASLGHGASLHVATEEERFNPKRFQELLRDSTITVGDLPPAVLGLLEPQHLPNLRLVFVGGEAYPGALVTNWNAGRRFVNGYGPTECTVTMTAFDCEGPWETSPPIGRPIGHHTTHVVDEQMRPVSPGTPGELLIGGPGLAYGYLGQPGLTATAFVPDPFGARPGNRLYRTGDLVEELPTGDLRFLGRIDRQVKVNGIRVELGEIESAMAAFEGVTQACVRSVSDGRGRLRLVGYVSRPTEAAPFDLSTMRAWLRDRLPAALIPAEVHVLERLPLTPSGKIDEVTLGALVPLESDHLS